MKNIRGAALVAAALLVACGDGLLGVESGMSKEDADALAGALGRELWLATPMPGELTVGGSRDEVTRYTDTGAACAGGGRASIPVAETRVFEDFDSLTVTASMAWRPYYCRLDQDGTTFRLTGDTLRVELRFHATRAQEITVDLRAEGRLGWLIDGREGACALDLVMEESFDQTAGEIPGGMITGTLCEHTVEYPDRFIRR